MPKSPDQQTPQENKGLQEKNQRFESLVGDLIKKSSLFPDVELLPDDTLSIMNAIENNEASTYTGSRASDQMLDAITCLNAIYDELGKEDPDEDHIEQVVEQLKEYL